MAADGAQHLEAAHVRAHQHGPPPGGQRVLDDLLAMHLDLKQVEAPVEQIDPVVDGGGKAEEVPIQVGQRGLPTQRPAQIVTRGGRRLGAKSRK